MYLAERLADFALAARLRRLDGRSGDEMISAICVGWELLAWKPKREMDAH